MAFFFGDGFDLYQSDGKDCIPGHWDSSSNIANGFMVPGRFTGSRAWSWFYQNRLDKISGQNDPVHHINIALNQQGSLAAGGSGNGGIYVTFWDGATAQCTIMFAGDGYVKFFQGNTAGTLLGTYTGALTAGNTWFAFEFEAVINNTTGSFAVRKLGNPTNDFTLNNVNTRMSTNNYANKITFGHAVNFNTYTDDFLWRSGTTVPWYGDVRCYTRSPNSDVQAQFSRTTNAVTWSPWSTGGGINSGFAGNSPKYIPFYPQYSGRVTGLILGTNYASGGGTGHIKAAIFADNNGLPGTLLATSTEITNPPPNQNTTFTFPSGVRLQMGSQYWYAINCDATMGMLQAAASFAGLTTYNHSVAPSYAAWPAVSMSNLIVNTGNAQNNALLIYTPEFNCDVVSEAQEDGTLSYLYASAPGPSDLFGISGIPNTPLNIVGLVTRAYAMKSDAGTRNLAVQLKSGGVLVQGPSTAINTVWGWLSRVDAIDPATGVAWTPIGVNSVQIGIEVKA